MGPETLKVVTALEGATERTVKRLTLEVTANLQERTPVDVGWARANWVPSIGNPYRISVGNLSEDERRAQLGSAQAQQQSGTAQVAATYRLSQGSTFVSNNVPYIVFLNNGTSQQAPAAFVQQEIQNAIDTVQRRP